MFKFVTNASSTTPDSFHSQFPGQPGKAGNRTSNHSELFMQKELTEVAARTIRTPRRALNSTQITTISFSHVLPAALPTCQSSNRTNVSSANYQLSLTVNWDTQNKKKLKLHNSAENQ